METNKKYMFTEMVKDKEDIEGMIAYCLYKFEKIKFIQNYENIKHEKLKDKELKDFHDLEIKNISAYQIESENILEDTLNFLIQPKIDEIDKIQNILNLKEDTINKKELEYKENKTKEFWRAVGQNIVSTLIFLFISFLIIAGTKFGDIISWIQGYISNI